MVSVLIPYIDQLDELRLCLKYLEDNTLDYELILIDNASEKPLDRQGEFIKHHHNDENIGVLQSLKQGYELMDPESTALVFIHSDVLIHERAWDARLEKAMEDHPEVGLLGFFGALGTGSNGGRIRPMNNMQGKVWGACPCHDPVGLHHGELVIDFSYAGGMDGLSMIFKPECMKYLIDHTDTFADWRPLHHFTDRFIPLKVIDAGWKLGYLGVALDHLSGATANRSDIYRESARKWLEERGHISEDAPDLAIYKLAEKQLFDEFGSRLGVVVDPATGDYYWNI